jgi:hypothetical protein
VTSIGGNAFYNCTSLTNIEIPNNVTSIGYGTFSYCSSLTNIQIPASVISVGKDAFYHCPSLTSVTYLGTKEQALKLDIGSKARKRWREGSAISKIICTDGVIEL